LGGGAANQIKAGKLRALGVAGEKRAAVAPDAPTYAESGFPGFSAASWVGVFAPAKTDPAQIETINKAIEEVMKDPDVQKRLTGIGFDPIHGSAAEAQTYFNSEVKKWGDMVHTLGLSIN
jgi:tripartite-type tricarboxylate transporter receptor subunit TctC